jgi:hypothetical protein
MRCDRLLTILNCCTTYLVAYYVDRRSSPPLYRQVMIYSVTLTGSDKFLFLSRVIQPRHLFGHFTPQGHACCNTACVQRLSVFFLLNGLLVRNVVIACILWKVLKLQILQNHELFILCFINIRQIGGVCLAIHITAYTCSSVVMYVCNKCSRTWL